MKRVFAGFLVLSIFFSNVCFASPTLSKTESVFINLDYYGKVDKINVYNSFNIAGADEIKDYGEYEAVSNLTNKTECKIGENGERVWEVSEVNSFSYTGKMDNKVYERVPWSFEVLYKLNGVLTNPRDLVHKSGVVEIDVNIDANDKANEYYRNNYMLEVTGTFDMNDYLSVESDEAMFVSTGNTKTMMLIVLPGQSKDFSLRIGATDFNMSGLTFAMVPLEGEIFEKISEITKDKKDFEDAFEEINRSTDIVLYAMKDMNLGMKEMKEGLSVLKEGNDKIHKLSPGRKESVSRLITSINELKDGIQNNKNDLENLDKMISDAFDMLEDIEPHIKSISERLNSIEGDMSDIEGIIEDLPEDIDDIKDLIDTMVNLTNATAGLVEAQDSAGSIDVSELKRNLTEIGGAVYSIKGELESPDVLSITDPTMLSKLSTIGENVSVIGTELGSVQSILTEVESALGTATTSKKSLVGNIKRLSRELDNINDMIEADDGEIIIDSVSDFKKLIKELKDTSEVVYEYTDKVIDNREDSATLIGNLKNALDNIDKMLGATNSLLDILQSALDVFSGDVYEGSNESIDGIIGVTDEMISVTSQADQFIYSKDKAKDVVKKRWDKIDGETNLFKIDVDSKAVSFSSEKNDSPDKVQFLLKLPDIMEVNDIAEDLEATDNTGNFWTRLVNVFYKMIEWILGLFRRG